VAAPVIAPGQNGGVRRRARRQTRPRGW
jgi:hypothetical protein